MGTGYAICPKCSKSKAAASCALCAGVGKVEMDLAQIYRALPPLTNAKTKQLRVEYDLKKEREALAVEVAARLVNKFPQIEQQVLAPALVREIALLILELTEK